MKYIRANSRLFKALDAKCDEIYNLHDIILAGGDFENLSHEELYLHRNNAKKLSQSYRENLHQVFDDISRCQVSALAQEELDKYVRFGLSFARYERRMHYVSQKKVFWELPDELDEVFMEPNFEPQYTITARLIWLINRDQDEKQSDEDESRYLNEDSVWDLDDQWSALPDEYRWLFDYNFQPSLDRFAFMQYAGGLMQMEREFYAHLPLWLEELKEQGVPRVAQYDIFECCVPILCDDECPICTETYGSLDLEDMGIDTEAAVELECGHIIGNKCLQAWVDSDNENSAACPLCRRKLFDIIDGFPVSMRPTLRAFETIIGAVSEYKNQIDAFLLDGTRENLDVCYEVEVGQMIHDLQYLYERARKEQEKLMELLEP